VNTSETNPNDGGALTEVDYNTFTKVDMRVGTVKSAVRVPDTDKLICMQVSFGSFDRQIVAGIGKVFTPESLSGRQFIFVVNLAPRKLRGVESHGMMLAASDKDKLALIVPDSNATDGASVG